MDNLISEWIMCIIFHCGLLYTMYALLAVIVLI